MEEKSPERPESTEHRAEPESSRPVSEPSRPEEPPKSSFWKVQAVVFEPRQAFEELRRNPTWLLPMILTILFALIASVTLVYSIGAEEIVLQSMEQSGQDITDQAVDIAVLVTNIFTWVGPLIWVPIAVLLAAAVYLLCFMLIGGEPTFRKFFAVVAHTLCINALIGVVLIGLLIALTDPAEIDLKNPLATNLGVFVERSDSPVFHVLLTAFDLPTLYYLVLTGVGLAIVSRKKELGGGLGVSFGVYFVWTLGRMGFAAIFG